MLMPSRPIVVYANSETTNWRKKECVEGRASHNLTAEEEVLIKSKIKDIVTKINGAEYRKWGYVSEAVHKYVAAGVQCWTHTHHAEYKCLGPYIEDWQGNAARWHPSVLGHQMRGAQYSVVWLSIFAEALEAVDVHLHNIIASNSSNNSQDFQKLILKAVSSNLNAMQSSSSSVAYSLPPPIHATNITDKIQCFTDYEPRYHSISSLYSNSVFVKAGIHSIKGKGSANKDEEGDKTSLLGLVFGNVTIERIIYEISENSTQHAAFDIDARVPTKVSYKYSTTNTSSPTLPATPWKAGIYEFRSGVRMGAMRHYASKGYKDVKYILWGDVSSGPITFKISVKRDEGGYVFICEPPGVARGKDIEFAKLFELYLHNFSQEEQEQLPLANNKSSNRGLTLVLDDKSKREYHHQKGLEICWQLTDPVPAKGEYLLTYLPTSQHTVMIAYLLVP
jgi:hypothetical protein